MSSSTLASSAMEMNSCASVVPGTQAIDAMPVATEALFPAETFVDGRKLVRGLRWALSIEGVVALVIYAAWYVWQLFH
jgi:hypothetical protein